MRNKERVEGADDGDLGTILPLGLDGGEALPTLKTKKTGEEIVSISSLQGFLSNYAFLPWFFLN